MNPDNPCGEAVRIFCYPPSVLLQATPPVPADRPPGEAGGHGPVVILGGGVSGLCTAWQLHRQGIPVVVLEANAVPGGVIRSVREGQWLRETGPNTLFESTPQIRAFVQDLGLEDRRLEAAPSAQRRYVVRGGRTVALPATPLQFAASPLLSWPAKLRLLGEPFRARAPRESEESVAQFVTRRLGPEFLDYIVNPFVAGIYAGDPAELSVRQAFPKLHTLEQEHGSMVRGSLARRNASGGPKGAMISFPDGLAEIPLALAHALGADLRLEHRVTALTRGSAGWRVSYEHRGERGELAASAVICTLPPEKLADLGWADAPIAAALGELRAVHQPPVASVFLGFKREDVAHPLDGFGMLTPAIEQRKILGTLFSSTLFPGRAPAGHVALTTFVGGVRQPDYAQLPDAELLALVQGEMAALLGTRGGPVFARVQRWPRAIPQYAVGFQRFKDACRRAEQSAPGLFIGGTACDGVSLANCIAAGERLAGVVERYLAPV
jgi:oxygen-dependent protoporphyrinogen oxidase